LYCAVPMPHAAETPSTRPSRRGAAASVLTAVAALHALLLAGLPAGLGDDDDEGVRPLAVPVAVRTVTVAPPAAEAPVTATPARAARPAPAPPAAAPAAPEPVAAALPPGPRDDPPELEPPEPAASVAVAVADLPAAAPAQPASASAAEPGGEAMPVYATRLPAPARLAYVLRRGLLTGSGQLSWAPQADGSYEARLDGGVFGQNLLAQTSRGAIDAHGLAPDRFTDRRRGRHEQAANFQREAGKLSYSGPTVEFPLPPGAQDRVSWLVQLGAVLAANPALRAEGGEVRLFVTGARGDADVWTFVVQGRASLDLPGGQVPDTLHVLRLPRREFDTRAEAPTPAAPPCRPLLPPLSASMMTSTAPWAR
jgi:hypothetical protein